MLSNEMLIAQMSSRSTHLLSLQMVYRSRHIFAFTIHLQTGSVSEREIRLFYGLPRAQPIGHLVNVHLPMTPLKRQSGFTHLEMLGCEQRNG